MKTKVKNGKELFREVWKFKHCQIVSDKQGPICNILGIKLNGNVPLRSLRNARLIALAPNLLKVMISIHEFLSMIHEHETDKPCDYCYYTYYTEKIIKEALGEI